MDAPRKATVLLAEDEPRVAAPVSARLVADGHAVRWVRSLRDARAALREVPSPDVMLLDVTLESDGLEFLQAVRFAPEAPPGGIVVMADSRDPRIRERAHQLGAAAVVEKPLHADEVAAVVKDLLAVM